MLRLTGTPVTSVVKMAPESWTGGAAPADATTARTPATGSARNSRRNFLLNIPTSCWYDRRELGSADADEVGRSRGVPSFRIGRRPTGSRKVAGRGFRPPPARRV